METDLEDSFHPVLFKPSSLLPITRHRQSLLYAIEHFSICVVIGQTGSGKSTQIPQYLDQSGWTSYGKIIAVTQPRRVAVTTIASRVAQEIGCPLGAEVGYSIRFEDLTSARTRIKFLTDGLLLREALIDPLLSRYSVIMIDEAHERSSSTDVLLGLLRKITKRRPELRIIVSSATLEAEKLLDYLTNKNKAMGCILSISGRTFSIDVHHLKSPTDDYLQKSMETVAEIHAKEGLGDILVFLTGREEITQAVDMLEARNIPNLHGLPFYAGIPLEDQHRVFDSTVNGIRKVIFSTNVAEASVTIEGISFVVDCGFVKQRVFSPSTEIETLTALPISKAAATQRSGRCGRMKSGKCYRLYTESAFAEFEAISTPDIQRSNLTAVVLQLKALGVDNVAMFGFLSPPPASHVAYALDVLYVLGALDEYGKLTKPLGKQMAELALEPKMSKCLLSASSFGCLANVLTILAMSGLQIFRGSKAKFAVDEGDHLTMLNVFHAYKGEKWCYANDIDYRSLKKAQSIRVQLQRQVERFGLEESSGDTRAIQKCLANGLSANIAKMQPDGSYRIRDGTTAYIHPSSVLFNRKTDTVVYGAIEETHKIFIKEVTRVL